VIQSPQEAHAQRPGTRPVAERHRFEQAALRARRLTE